MEHKMAHTPTPWKYERPKISQEEAWYIRTEDKSLFIAKVEGMTLGPEEVKANAAYIVKCCNSHDAMVRLLKRAKEETDDYELRRAIEAVLGDSNKD